MCGNIGHLQKKSIAVIFWWSWYWCQWSWDSFLTFFSCSCPGRPVVVLIDGLRKVVFDLGSGIPVIKHIQSGRLWQNLEVASPSHITIVTAGSSSSPFARFPVGVGLWLLFAVWVVPRHAPARTQGQMSGLTKGNVAWAGRSWRRGPSSSPVLANSSRGAEVRGGGVA